MAHRWWKLMQIFVEERSIHDIILWRTTSSSGLLSFSRFLAFRSVNREPWHENLHLLVENLDMRLYLSRSWWLYSCWAGFIFILAELGLSSTEPDSWTLNSYLSSILSSLGFQINGLCIRNLSLQVCWLYLRSWWTDYVSRSLRLIFEESGI